MRKIKLGDNVKVLSGKDKGKTGEVVKVFPKTNKVVVKGINILTKHEKQSGNQKGGIVKIEGPIPVSKVILLDPATGKPTRVRFEIDEKTGKKYRVAVKTGKKIEK